MNDANAFCETEIDYFGWLYCKDIYWRKNLDDCDLFKCYVVLYTCESTRSVLLELVPDASSKYFVYSLRRFLSRRGCPGNIVIDNGTNYLLFGWKLYQENPNWESNSDIAELDLPKRIEYVESIKEHFRKRWSFEYVTSLRECLKKFQTGKIRFFWHKMIWYYYTKKSHLYKNGCYVIPFALSKSRWLSTRIKSNTWKA